MAHLWSSAERSPSWRARAMTSQMTSSATLRVLLKGALNTGTPCTFAACRGAQRCFRDHLSEYRCKKHPVHKLRHAAGVAEGRIEHGNPLHVCSLQGAIPTLLKTFSEHTGTRCMHHQQQQQRTCC